MSNDSLDELYQKTILEHSRNPKSYYSLKNYTHSAQGYNRMCGDKVAIEVFVDEKGLIDQAGFQGESCAVCKASASMLVERIVGMNVSEVFDWLDELAYFSKSWKVDETKLGPMVCFKVMESYPTRRKCLELPWNTLKSALLAKDLRAEEKGE